MPQARVCRCDLAGASAACHRRGAALFCRRGSAAAGARCEFHRRAARGDGRRRGAIGGAGCRRCYLLCLGFFRSRGRGGGAAAATCERGSRHGTGGAKLLRIAKLPRWRGPVARPARRAAAGTRCRDRHPKRQHRPEPHHAAAPPAAGLPDHRGQPGRRTDGRDRRYAAARCARHRHRPAHRGAGRRGGVLAGGAQGPGPGGAAGGAEVRQFRFGRAYHHESHQFPGRFRPVVRRVVCALRGGQGVRSLGLDRNAQAPACPWIAGGNTHHLGQLFGRRGLAGGRPGPAARPADARYAGKRPAAAAGRTR